jgi:23S rRNA (uracil1939-C5)-methyltransferase
VELAVERLTYGPAALSHLGGQVVFVALAAPGDRVRARIVARRRGYLQAEVEQVLAAGSARAVPGCPAFPECGGCQWQHVTPPAQHAAKRAVVAEQLARLARLRTAEVLPALTADDWAYRARITLAAEGRRLGYHRAASHRLVEIGGCPIADPVVSAHVRAARELAAQLRTAVERLTIAAAPGGVVFVARLRRGAVEADRRAAETLLVERPSVRGIVLLGAGQRLVLGDVCVRVVLEPGLDVEVPADVFTQVNPAGNRLLVATALAFAGAGPGSRVLDLYAGAGNFALPLARRGARVHAIERSALAVDVGRLNAHRLGLDVRLEHGDVAAALAREPVGAADVVVLDPPRRGAGDAIAALGRLRAPRLVYVSCDPATLARDVGALLAGGYRLGRIQPIDLFPQTYHVETVTELLLT